MNRETRKKLRNWGIVGSLVLLGITSYALYQSYSNQTIPEETVEKKKKYTSRPVTIVLTESILSSKLPLNEILKKTEDIVLVAAPGLSIDDLKLDSDITYKVIECETYAGIWSIVQHLKSEVIFVVRDDLEEEIPKGLERYVGEIVELDQNYTVINETILSYILN